jgi:hypothetical protein
MTIFTINFVRYLELDVLDIYKSLEEYSLIIINQRTDPNLLRLQGVIFCLLLQDLLANFKFSFYDFFWHLWPIIVSLLLNFVWNSNYSIMLNYFSMIVVLHFLSRMYGSIFSIEQKMFIDRYRINVVEKPQAKFIN